MYAEDQCRSKMERENNNYASGGRAVHKLNPRSFDDCQKSDMNILSLFFFVFLQDNKIYICISCVIRNKNINKCLFLKILHKMLLQKLYLCLIRIMHFLVCPEYINKKNVLSICFIQRNFACSPSTFSSNIDRD